ncbi:hypothetical protein XELAEV_18042854mg [Xenopus laevis]|uniref:Secreted protein n=1 Tax=Xenopus laevis TaxID=8355 RepID=A0A974H6Y1_XENLA|nr:hypothetical protein XELAEV_18042854mg [Xenopus laevis]
MVWPHHHLGSCSSTFCLACCCFSGEGLSSILGSRRWLIRLSCLTQLSKWVCTCHIPSPRCMACNIHGITASLPQRAPT